MSRPVITRGQRVVVEQEDSLYKKGSTGYVFWTGKNNRSQDVCGVAINGTKRKVIVLSSLLSVYTPSPSNASQLWLFA